MYCYRLILLLIFFCFVIENKAQEKSISQIEKIQSAEDRPLNNISLNILGDASILSINFEKLYLVRKSFILTTKFGLGYNQEFRLCIFGPCSSPAETCVGFLREGTFSVLEKFFPQQTTPESSIAQLCV